ncbi:MAG: serine hydrolase [Saprospiraceae bacterium]|nr:serine hydrolase [Pyrinomonadaceae bacterium]
MTHLIRRLPAIFLFLLCITATMVIAQDKAASIDEMMKLHNQYGHFNGSVLVAENGRVIYKKGFGMANMEWNVPNDTETKFRLASITKQFTAAVILQLAEQGKLKLDGKITDYLPDYRKDTGDRITIHQLLNHTSGIPSYTALPNFMKDLSRDPYTPAEVVKKYASGDLEFEPGTKYNYNNSAYFMLGAIIEKVTGKTYAQVMQENIFTPAGMKNSGYDSHSALIPKRATGYTKTRKGYINADYLDMSLPYSAGSLYSTAEDLYLWDQALYGDKILSAKSKELMFKPNLENYGYGVGAHTITLSDKKTAVPTIGHSGGINGFSTNIIRFTGDKHLIVLLDNSAQGGRQDKMISAIANILYGQPYDAPKRSIGETVLYTLEAQGIDAAVKQYRDIKANSKDYDAGEAELNLAGYELLRTGKVKEAGEIFKLNVEMFPNAANPHDSLGEYYATGGQKDLAIKEYKRALEIDPKFPSAIAAIKRLETPTVAVDPKIYESYAAQYHIAPNFILTITTANGKLFGQATGQPQFELEPRSETKFAIAIVGAEIDFIKDTAGKVTSLILHQGGRDTPANRLP